MGVLWMIRWFCVLGLFTLTTLIAVSSLEMPLMAGLRATVDTWWGVTTMVDLYLGLFAVAGWIAYRERCVVRAIAWFVGLCLLGNFTMLVYLLIASWRARAVEELWRPVR
jgi:hypothetical protein